MKHILVCLLLLTVSLGSPAESGTITGRVQIQKTDQQERPRRYYMGPYRSGRHATMIPEGPQNTVIYLKAPIPPSEATAAPVVEMKQENEMFVPYVLPIQKGTSVSFPNKDAYYHNVFSVMSGERFDLGRYARGETTFQTFDTPGVVVVRCEIHPGMKAYILILDTPHFAVPDASGEFSLPNIPPGTYELVSWHPDHGNQSQTVTVSDDQPTLANFAY